MQSLLQTATTPPCGTPLALFRVAGPYLGKRNTRSLFGSSSVSAKSFSISRNSTSSCQILRYQTKQAQTANPWTINPVASTSVLAGNYSSTRQLHTLNSSRKNIGLRPLQDTLALSTSIASTALGSYSSDRLGTQALLRAQSRAYSTAEDSKMYTASFAFFEAIWEAGVTHCFVNLGSDHPSIIEAMVKGQREKDGQFPRIITCPNEVCLHPLYLSRLSHSYISDGCHVHG